MAKIAKNDCLKSKKNCSTGTSNFHDKMKKPKSRILNKGRRIILRNEKSQLSRVLQNKLISFGRRKSRIHIRKETNDKAAIRKIISDLKNQGPAGLLHLNFISKAIQRNIRVYKQNNKLEFVIGQKRYNYPPIDVEYHEPGHWTEKDNENPHCKFSGLNDCLFSAIASQLNQTPGEIRHLTIREMKRNQREVGKQIVDLEKLKAIDPDGLMMGGAMYDGRSARDAKRILDNSQKGIGHHFNTKGHPRGHASHPTAKGEFESVENYSRTGRKTAFLSRSEQDFVAHLALDSDPAQEAMEKLNDELSVKKVSRISRREFGDEELPKAVEYVKGKAVGDPEPFREVVAVLGHHKGKHKDPEADVFVLTFYPVL